MCLLTWVCNQIVVWMIWLFGLCYVIELYAWMTLRLCYWMFTKFKLEIHIWFVTHKILLSLLLTCLGNYFTKSYVKFALKSAKFRWFSHSRVLKWSEFYIQECDSTNYSFLIFLVILIFNVNFTLKIAIPPIFGF